MNRWWVAFAGACLVLGFLLMGWLAPDAGPAVEIRPPPDPRPLAAAAPADAPPRPRPPPRRHDLETLGEEEGFAPPAPREVRPPAPVDPDQVFEPDLRGLASAAVSRRDRMVDCIRTYQQQSGEQGYDGRFTLRITVSPGEEDEGVVGTEVVNGPDDERLQTCLDEAMADARFTSPDHDFSMMWPVPLPPTE